MATKTKKKKQRRSSKRLTRHIKFFPMQKVIHWFRRDLRLEDNTAYFRAGLTKAGLTLRAGTHPIVPVMLGDAALAQKFSARMLEKGVYVIGFFYPVVPQGTARIRTQVSAAHSREDLDFAIQAFSEVKQELGL